MKFLLTWRMERRLSGFTLTISWLSSLSSSAGQCSSVQPRSLYEELSFELQKYQVSIELLSQLHLYFAVILNLTRFSRKFYYFSSDLSFAWLPLHTIEDKFPALERTSNEQQTCIHRSEARSGWGTGSRRKYRTGTDYWRRNILVSESCYCWLKLLVSSQRISL